MTNLIQFDGFENDKIRVTEDGRYSVYDVIKFCGKKNPREAWKALVTQYSEVVRKTDNLKFPGPGQRETPVANSGTAKQIKEERGLAKSDNLRDAMSLEEMSATMFAETLASKKIEEQNIQGFPGCRDKSKTAAEKVKELMDMDF